MKWRLLLIALSLCVASCGRHTNESIVATKMSVTDQLWEDSIRKCVLESACYKIFESPQYLDMYCFREDKVSSDYYYKISILGCHSIKKSYYGYFVLNNNYFFVYGDIPPNTFHRESIRHKFNKIVEPVSVGGCPDWYLKSIEGKVSMEWNECDE